MNEKKYYAHSTDKIDKSDWQLLEAHLDDTAKLSSDFSGKFNQAELGRLAGLFHDLGKYSKKFQRRLEGKEGKVDHATAGAKETAKLFPEVGEYILAHCIAGHHGGLIDTGSGVDEKCLAARLKKTVDDYSHYTKELEGKDLGKPVINLQEKSPFEISFLTRMIYSALVDADWLDTERFCENGKIIRSDFASLETLQEQLSNHLNKLKENAPKECRQGEINRERNKILQDCLEKAKGEKGLYSLTVPTGGGKTLSSLAFALTHAIENKQDRIIYAIPYTSIIEQNAGVFKKIFGEKNVLEHHSNYIFEESGKFGKNDEEQDKDEKQVIAEKLKYASENWDAPIIATTNVQFFESLFASKKSRCRKLHNIANSVIILDEAQMIPTEYLIPCTKALDELVSSYNCTVVLCTATQPPLQEYFSTPIQEIMSKPKELFDFFKRVDVQHIGRISDDNLISEISDKNQVLTIVNTKKHAKELYDKMINANDGKDEGIYHLSTLMCPVHRKQVIEKLKGKKDKNGNIIEKGLLEQGVPTKVFSTQLIEAGVDIDFPNVYRSSAGLDSIAQSAGRCNREGRLDTLGVVKVFESAEKHGMPHGSLKLPSQVGKDIINNVIGGELPDMLSDETIKRYFGELFFYKGKEYLGLPYIKTHFKQSKKDGKLIFEFRTAAKEFNFIKDNTYPVIVPFDENAEELIKKLKTTEFTKKYLRQLQPYTVNLYKKGYDSLINRGALDNFSSDLIAVLLNFDKNYNKNTGIIIDNDDDFLNI